MSSDIVDELVERLQSHMGKADMGEVLRDCRLAAARIEALQAELAKAREALEPFSNVAGEMFARKWNARQIVVGLDNPDASHRVTAGDFFAARRTLQQKEESK